MRCMNPKVLVSLAAVGIGIFLFAPGVVSAAGPLLLVLACPLSMVLMMGSMSGGRRGTNAPTSDATADHDAGAEISRLRAEVDQLRAEVSQRQPTQDHT